VDVRAAGKELGVPLILEGSVRVEEGNTRVVVQLARTEDGVAVWSDSFDSKMSSSLDTQRSVARKVMSSLPLGA
jgi:TolB-like protein